MTTPPRFDEMTFRKAGLLPPISLFRAFEIETP